MADITPEQQAFTDKIIRLAQNDESFGEKLEIDNKAALVEVGLWDEYSEAFSDDVSGYVKAVQDWSTCCLTSSICCETL